MDNKIEKLLELNKLLKYMTAARPLRKFKFKGKQWQLE